MIIKRRIRRPEIIGVVATEQGLGATHLSLAIANYLHSVEGEKVIYIEMNPVSDIYQMVSKEHSLMGEILTYNFKGVRYLVSCSREDAQRIITGARCTVVIDFSGCTQGFELLFGLCSKKIVTGSLRLWKANHYETFINKNLYGKYDIQLVKMCAFGVDKKRKKKIKEMYGVSVWEVPYIENPLGLKEKDIKVIKKIIE